MTSTTIERREDTTGYTTYERKNYIRELPLLELPQAIGLLSPEERALFNRVFEIEVSNGQDGNGSRMDFPDQMRPWVEDRFKRDGETPEETLETMSNQGILVVRNRFTKEGGIYNPNRLNRPRDITRPDTYRQDIERTKENCSFCDPTNQTPETIAIGRFSDEYNQSFANLTKFAKYHEIIAGSHNPFDKTRDIFSSQIAIAQKIARKVIGDNGVRGIDPAAQFMMIGENQGPDSGASMYHQHKQVMLSAESMHFPDAERWHEASAGKQGYRVETGRDFTSDWFLAHEMVGLGFRVPDVDGDVLVAASMTPKKDYGVTVIGPRFKDPLHLSQRFIDTCWGVEEFMMMEQGVEQFNTALYLPPLSRTDAYWNDFRPMFVFTRRTKSDMGIMEGAGTAVLSVDPKSFAGDLFSHLQKAA